jgi:hypothetical protein
MVIDLKTGAPQRWHALQVAAYEHLDCSIPLDFDEESHTYKLEGRVIPSVTQILWNMEAISECSTFIEYPRARGTAVHQACALLPDRLDWSTVDPRLVPMIASYCVWLTGNNIRVEAQEQRGYNAELGYAGTLDLRVGNWPSGTLYLDGRGGMPKFVAHSNRRDWHTFVSMTNVYHWRNNGRD